MTEPIIYPIDPGVEDSGGEDVAFLAAAKAWAADPTNGGKKTTMVNAYTADITNKFLAVGTKVVLHQRDGTDATFAACVTAAAATYATAALAAWLAVPHALPE